MKSTLQVQVRNTIGVAILALPLSLWASSTPPEMVTTSSSNAISPSEQDVSDSYIYLLGRLLVTRQQQLDFKEGFVWNHIVHRKPGGVDWPNPNLDVAYSEAWVATDEGSCTLVNVPKVVGRYYSVQFLNGWGETLANINERTFPDHPSGTFAVCLKGANVALPTDAKRIDLPVKYTRVLARIELGKNWDEAVALQHQIDLKATGTPAPPEIPRTPIFEYGTWPGVEAFDVAELALDSEADINPGMAPLQAKVRAIAKVVKADPAERARVDRLISERALVDFAKAGPLIGHGSMRNGWAVPSTAGTYGNDYLTRTLVNYGGIWANSKDEVTYYRCNLDNTLTPLDSSHVYTQTFPKDQLPARFVNYFWSVIAVDSKRFRVLPNPTNRFLLNNQSNLVYNNDGSLTLYYAAEKPEGAPDSNWLPTPKGQNYRLTFRYYGPKAGVRDGSYFPPQLVKQN
ncbi:DUF1254 domain-containing protein [Pseudomonas sp. C1C7]|uniref:DUF1214 domain-containing protein n=1 Tax=Pseudomonas sp. C1C7 TaxID=2735272 RepID=UPI0015867FED|nr:DUF1214 domain-containing protein [Pseudomonas sp. C1C7]NUT79060.1 DUF1254 domain-containing protein [Pseudomonas sp. C1C7]